MSTAPAIATADLPALRDPAAPLAEVLRAVRAGEAVAPGAPALRIGLSATATLDLLATMLRRQALVHGMRAEVHQGALGSHLENVERFREAEVDHLVIVTTLDAVLPAFEARAATLDDELVRACAERIGAELALVLRDTTSFATVDVALLHRTSAPVDTVASRAVDAAVAQINAAVRAALDDAPGARVLDVGDALAQVGYRAAIDHRFALRFGAPYTAAACDELARRVVLATRASAGVVPKALVLDCDGTLWGGVLGEDGLEGIALDPTDYPGNAFWAVQHTLLALRSQGVLLCLASKNNPADVAEAFERHPAMVLGPDDLVVQKVSWDDKVDSLQTIAEELGIALGSLVFVDDSDFEIESVRSRLPQVSTFRVPREPWAWPALAGRIGELFTTGRPRIEADKTEQYRVRALASAEVARHATREDYLASLDMEVGVRADERATLPRIAELSRKSNQFNLTTRRYGEGELAAAMDDPAAAVLSLHVRDRFGDHGLVGVLVVRFVPPAAEIEAFLLSCRVLGREIELAPWPAVCRLAAEHGCTGLRASFLATAKNAQVARFYDRLHLDRVEETPMAVRYAAPLGALSASPPDHLAVHVS